MSHKILSCVINIYPLSNKVERLGSLLLFKILRILPCYFKSIVQNAQLIKLKMINLVIKTKQRENYEIFSHNSYLYLVIISKWCNFTT